MPGKKGMAGKTAMPGGDVGPEGHGELLPEKPGCIGKGQPHADEAAVIIAAQVDEEATAEAKPLDMWRAPNSIIPAIDIVGREPSDMMPRRHMVGHAPNNMAHDRRIA